MPWTRVTVGAMTMKPDAAGNGHHLVELHRVWLDGVGAGQDCKRRRAAADRRGRWDPAGVRDGAHLPCPRHSGSHPDAADHLLPIRVEQWNSQVRDNSYAYELVRQTSPVGWTRPPSGPLAGGARGVMPVPWESVQTHPGAAATCTQRPPFFRGQRMIDALSPAPSRRLSTRVRPTW